MGDSLPHLILTTPVSGVLHRSRSMDIDCTTRHGPMSDSHMDNVIEILSSPVGTPVKRKLDDATAARDGKENEAADKKAKVDQCEPSGTLPEPLYGHLN